MKYSPADRREFLSVLVLSHYPLFRGYEGSVEDVRKGDLPVEEGTNDQLRPLAHTVAAARGLDMLVCRCLRDAENTAGLPVSFAHRYQRHAGQLPLGQSRYFAGMFFAPLGAHDPSRGFKGKGANQLRLGKRVGSKLFERARAERTGAGIFPRDMDGHGKSVRQSVFASILQNRLL